MVRGQNVRFTDVPKYLLNHKYPTLATLNIKRSIRRAAQRNYTISKGRLYYRSCRTIQEDVSTQGDGEKEVFGQWKKVLKTDEERRQVLENMHASSLGGHFGRDKTLNKIEARYWWPSLVTDVKSFIRRCPQCQRVNPKDKGLRPALQPIRFQPAAWDKIGIDLIGPIPKTSSGNCYVMTVTDYFSKWAEARALPSKEGDGVTIFLADLFLQYGFPRVIISDQGREFRTNVLDGVCKRLKIDRRRTGAYHPQCNGLTERYNRTLTTQLLKLTDKLAEWDAELTACLFAYRTSVHATTGYTPFYLMYCREAKLPEDIQEQSDDEDARDDVGDSIHANVEEEEGEDEQSMDDDDPSNTRRSASPVFGTISQPIPSTSRGQSSAPATSSYYDEAVRDLTRVRKAAFDRASSAIKVAQMRQKRNYDSTISNEQEMLQIGQKVIRKNNVRGDRKGGKELDPWLGPYTIFTKGQKGFYLQSSGGKKLVRAVTACQLKIFHE